VAAGQEQLARLGPQSVIVAEANRPLARWRHDEQ
jgi:hypothetical protein